MSDQSPRAKSSPLGNRIHFVGAKGTGMTALAEIYASKGARLSGSDVPDVFYTDAILARLGMKVTECFDARNIDATLDLVVYSDAYGKDTNPELLEAARLGIPMSSYAEALGTLSLGFDSSGIAGVHGKTTTTAMVGCILDALGVPATVLAGSAVSNFGGSCTLLKGSRYLVAETDEYRRHFLHYHPKRILLTSIESDHQDYYPTLDSIVEAYREYVASLPEGGFLVYCADDPGASILAREFEASRKDITFIPYGFKAEGPWKILTMQQQEGAVRFTLAGVPGEWRLHVPGSHLALNAAGAVALATLILEDYLGGNFDSHLRGIPDWEAMRSALAAFSGSKRRSEIVGEAHGVLFVDDYAHHPTAVRVTLEGMKAFWPSRRLVVDFMSHTYSRTKALMDEFAASLDPADCIILHEIYASAREKPDPAVTGRLLYRKVSDRRAELARIEVGAETNIANQFIYYTERPLDEVAAIARFLRPGDLFLTMGAGDNWKLGRALFEMLRGRKN